MCIVGHCCLETLQERWFVFVTGSCGRSQNANSCLALSLTTQ